MTDIPVVLANNRVVHVIYPEDKLKGIGVNQIRRMGSMRGNKSYESGPGKRKLYLKIHWFKCVYIHICIYTLVHTSVFLSLIQLRQKTLTYKNI